MNSLNAEFCSLANYMKGVSDGGSYYLCKCKTPPLTGNPSAAFCSPWIFPKIKPLPWCLDNRMVTIYKTASSLFWLKTTWPQSRNRCSKGREGNRMVAVECPSVTSLPRPPAPIGEQPANQLRCTGPAGQRDHLLSMYLPEVGGAASQSYRAYGKPKYHQQKLATV